MEVASKPLLFRWRLKYLLQIIRLKGKLSENIKLQLIECKPKYVCMKQAKLLCNYCVENQQVLLRFQFEWFI